MEIKFKKNIIVKPDFEAENGTAYVQVYIGPIMDGSGLVISGVIKYVFINMAAVECKIIHPNVSVYVVNEKTGGAHELIFHTGDDIEPCEIEDDRLSELKQIAMEDVYPRMTVSKKSMISAYHNDMLNILCKRYAKILLAGHRYDISDIEFLNG